MKVVSIVGMAGSGKSEAARMFEKSGFSRIRFGDLTDEEVKKRGLELSEENERQARESLRQAHGMAAYAKLNLPKIDVALAHSNVIIDGLYSWEEYRFLKDYYKDSLYVIAVWSSPEARYARLNERKIRNLTTEEAASRDRAEIENINKGGPIAMADYTIINDSSMENLTGQISRMITELK